MKIQIIIPIKFLKLPNGLILDIFQLVDGKNIEDDIGDVFRGQLGEINMNLILTNSVLYFNGDKDDIPLYSKMKSNLEIATSALKFAENVFNRFWLYTDNSIQCNMAFAFSTNDSACVMSTDSHMTNFTGEATIKEFTRDEIHSALEIASTHQKVSGKTLVIPVPEQKYNHNTISKNLQNYIPYTHNRFYRAFGFLQKARLMSHLIIKIMFYMALYEALFSTVDTGIAHQIAERAKHFCGEDTKHEENYKLIKRAYGIRSRYIHGDIINKNNDYLISITEPLDALTRKIMLLAYKEEIFFLGNSPTDKNNFNFFFTERYGIN